MAGLVVLGIGGYFGYRMLFSGGFPERIATREGPRSTTPALTPAPEPEPSKDAVPAPRPTAQDTVSVKPAPAMPLDSMAKATTKDKDATAAVSTTAPGSTKAPGEAVPKMDSSKAPSKATNLPGPSGSPSTAEAPGITAQGRTSTQQTAQPDRWQQMREAMARCAGDNFFKRVACEQAVGQQYCEGFWGKVPQCPSGPPNKDRGQ